MDCRLTPCTRKHVSVLGRPQCTGARRPGSDRGARERPARVREVASALRGDPSCGAADGCEASRV